MNAIVRSSDRALSITLCRSPAVVVVAPGPPNPASTDVLYVAATRSTAGLSAYRDIVPSLCVRSRLDLALVSGDDQLNPSRIDVEIQHRDAFRVHYVGGFSSAGFTYFVAVQRPSATADRATLPVTRLARVCQNDRTMASYAELPLECRTVGPSSTTFQTARAVQVGHVSLKLARQLGLRPSSSLSSPSDQEHVLFVVFSSVPSSVNSGHASASTEHDGVDGGTSVDENDPIGLSTTSSSALCIYSMREVRRAFTTAIEKCFRGVGSTGPDHLVQPKPCYKTVSFGDLLA
jgi:plexin A